jgi:hypothetical protein
MTFNRFDFEKYTSNRTPKKGTQVKGHLRALFVTLLVWFVMDYLTLPAYTIKSEASIFFMCMIVGIFVVTDIIFTFSFNSIARALGTGIAFVLVATVIMNLASSPLFNAYKYRSQLNVVETSDFSKNFASIELSRIPLVDKAVAIKLGDKKVGEVAALGSQFEVNQDYTLVSSNNRLYRITPLEYRDFFKWFQNKDVGIPNYIKVNVNDSNDVELVKLKQGMRYAPSAFFNYNLFRHIRFTYRTELMTDYSFEIDDQGNPFWVVSVYEPEIGFFGGPDAKGVIICDPITGELQKYGIDEVPEWVDRVQPVQIASSQLNNWGQYINGYLNTIFGQRDMLKTTAGYNYVNIDGHTYAFTGMTSVGADQSIAGFTLINLRTKDAKFYKIGGADELSAMSSAEGQVQHLGYKATFPILLNIASQPTYFIALKDGEGLVKMYSFVNVTNYSIVGVGQNLLEAQNDYIMKLNNAGIKIDGVEDGTIDITAVITELRTAILEGNTVYYFQIADYPEIFTATIELSEELALTSIGDEVKIRFVNDQANLKQLINFDNLKYQLGNE